VTGEKSFAERMAALEKDNQGLRAEISSHAHIYHQKAAEGDQLLKSQTSALERDLEKQHSVIEGLESELQKQRQRVVDLENKLAQR